MYKKIKANAAYVPITLEGGCHGHIGLVTDTMTYNRITPKTLYLYTTHPSLLRFNNGTSEQIVEGIFQNNIAITTFHEENHI